MKKALLLFVPFCAFAAHVSIEDASEFAERWAESVDRGSPVISVSPYVVGGRECGYVAVRENGDALFLSNDDRVYPVLASSERIADRDGNITLPHGHPLWDMINVAMSNTTRRLSALSSAKSVSEEYEFNRSAWGRFRRPALRSASSGSLGNTIGGDERILDGFEPMGPLTHWNQDRATRGFSGSKPLYNYYMLSTSSGGAGPAGLDLTAGDAYEYPCGCVATALSAAAQYHRFAGVVQNPKCRNTLVVMDDLGGMTGYSKYLLPGEYDWSVLPSNYGGSASECHDEATFPSAARELIGRVTFNYGVATRSVYARGTTGGDTPLIPNRSATLMFADFTASMIDHAHINKGGFLTEPKTSYKDVSGLRDPRKFSRAVELAIRFGEPVVMGVSGARGMHCILAVGVRGSGDSTREIRVFMGWSGTGDTWFYGGGQSVGDMFSSITFGDVTGGYGHPTKFTWVVNAGVDTGMGLTRIRPLEISGSDVSVISNADGTVYGIAQTFPFSPETGSGPGYLRSSLRFTSAPFYESGVLITPSSVSYSWSQRYEFVDSSGSKFVYMTPMQEFFTETAVTLSGSGSKAYGFPHGTPENISGVAYSAFTNDVPMLVISGRDGVPDPIVNEFKTGASHSYMDRFVTYFIDTDTDRSSFDWTGSYIVFDPFKRIGSDMWDSDNPGRVAYGTFSSPLEILDVVTNGLAAYSALPRSRDNDHGLAWYKHPKIDTNPYVIPQSTSSIDMNSVRSLGYTSVTASGLTSITRSNVSSPDTTIRYVDFTECPATSSSSQMFRTFRGLVTAHGLPSGFTSVPPWCFASCEALETVDGLGPSITSLSQGAFYGCTSLKSASGIPSSVVSIGSQCFQNCTSLRNTDGIFGVTSLGDGVFSLSTSGSNPFEITEWPASVSSVPASTFEKRAGLVSVSGLPDSVTSYGSYAFSGAGIVKLDSVGTNVTSFGSSCFRDCYSLKSVSNLPASLTSVGQYCFCSCYDLTLVDFTGVDVSNLTIGSYAFYNTASGSLSLTVVFPATKSQVTSMANYSSWYLPSGKTTIRCTDGNLNL